VVKILVLSADVDAKELIIFALRFVGHQLKSASNIEECIEQAGQFNPDLLLLDGKLPGVNGIQANQHLKSHKITAGIPLILFQSNTSTDNILDEKTTVGDELTLNNISPDQFTDKVNGLVKRLPK
jgi:CheY-like chemotaxis protein